MIGNYFWVSVNGGEPEPALHNTGLDRPWRLIASEERFPDSAIKIITRCQCPELTADQFVNVGSQD